MTALSPGRRLDLDVVVVGGGNAGLSAAIAAAERGARVAVVQKLPEPGGKSSLAIGSISAAGTSLQRSRGISDDHDRHMQDLRARIAAGGVAPLSMRKLELAVEHGADAIERLIGIGVEFTGPHPEMPTETWRMHVISPDARALVAALADRAGRLGVEVITDWSADRLLVEPADEDVGRASRVPRVTGVGGARGDILARQVILASGDFSAPGRLGPFAPAGSAFAFRSWASGDGHLMAQSVGAQLTDVEVPLRVQFRTMHWPHIEPNPRLFRAGAILVDRDGNRHADETRDPARAFAAEGDLEVFLVADAQLLRRIPTSEEDSPTARDAWLKDDRLYFATFPGRGYAYVADLLASGSAVLADSAAKLATAAGMSPRGLANTLAEVDAAVAGSAPDRFGRTHSAGLREAPFLACGPFRARAILGRAGICTDDAMRALDGDGQPVPGLLAAGAAAGVTGFAYGHGYELAWAVVSGHLAGVTAAT